MSRYIDFDRDPFQPTPPEGEFLGFELPKLLHRGQILGALPRVRDLQSIPEKPKHPVIKMYTLEEMRSRIQVPKEKLDEEPVAPVGVIDKTTLKLIEQSIRSYFVGGDKGGSEKLLPSRVFEKNGKLIVSKMEKLKEDEDNTLSYGVIDFSENSSLRNIFGNFDNLYQSLRPIFTEILIQKFQKINNPEGLREQIEDELFTIVVEFLTLITREETYPVLIKPYEQASTPIFRIEAYKLLAYILKVLELRKTQKSYLSSVFLTTTNVVLKKAVEQYNSIYQVIFDSAKMMALSDMEIEDDEKASEIAKAQTPLEDFSDKNPFTLLKSLIYPGSEKLMSQYRVLKDREGKVRSPFQGAQIALELSKMANEARTTGQKTGLAELFVEPDNIQRGIYKGLFVETLLRVPGTVACKLPLSTGEVIDVQLPIRQLLEVRVNKSNESIIKVGAIWKSIGDYLAAEFNQAFEVIVNHMEEEDNTDIIDKYITDESQTKKYLLYATVGSVTHTGKEHYQPSEYREWQWSMAGLLKNVSESKLKFLEYIARNPHTKLPTLRGRLLELIEPYKIMRTSYENMNLKVPFAIAVQDAFYLSRMLFPDQPPLSTESLAKIGLGSPLFPKLQPLS